MKDVKNKANFSDDRKAFVNRLEICAEKAGSVAALSRLSGITAPAIADYLSGKSDPSRERTIAIAQAVKLSPSWLFTGEGSPELRQESPATTAPISVDGHTLMCLNQALSWLQTAIAAAERNSKVAGDAK